jgi:hypothetical protein
MLAVAKICLIFRSDGDHLWTTVAGQVKFGTEIVHKPYWKYVCQ